uniref:Zinc knuckle containing protein-like n=1 Tax=Oryza sativa subsp. indica TaxID=39946 RepID=C8TF11_ORYSI|nr:zinc knuckle containing protein-like [Oryza sativa Indica Group]
MAAGSPAPISPSSGRPLSLPTLYKPSLSSPPPFLPLTALSPRRNRARAVALSLCRRRPGPPPTSAPPPSASPHPHRPRPPLRFARRPPERRRPRPPEPRRRLPLLRSPFPSSPSPSG